jgi:uncharacterized protein (DUF2384 family)
MLDPEAATASETVAWAHDGLDLAYREIGHAVQADERTVRRWAGREIAPRGRHRRKLAELRELRHLLGVLFASDAEIRSWLHTPLRALHGRTPIAQVRAGGTGAVVEILATVEAGAYL